MAMKKHNIDFFLKDPPDWSDILIFFRGSELQNFFTKILEDHLKAIIKPQYVDQIPKAIKVEIIKIHFYSLVNKLNFRIY